MYTLRVVSSEKTTSIEDGAEYYDFNIEILKDEDVIETRRLAYTADEILAEGGVQPELDKFLEIFINDQETAEVNKESDEKEAQVSAALEDLKNVEITREAKTPGENGEVVAPVEEEIKNED